MQPRGLFCLVWLLYLSLPGLVSANSLLASNTGDAAPIAAPEQADIRELSRLLSDPRVLNWLQQQTDQVGDLPASQAEPTGQMMQEALESRLSALRQHVSRKVTAFWRFNEHLNQFIGQWQSSMQQGDGLRSVVYVLVFLIIGMGLEWLFWRYAENPRIRLENDTTKGLGRRISRTFQRALLHSIGITLFAIGSVGAFLYFQWESTVKLLVLSFLLAVVIIRIINTVLVFLLCPRVETLRPLPMSTATARFFYRWIMVILTIGTVGFLVTPVSTRLRIHADFPLVLNALIASVIALLLVVAIWQWWLGQRRRIRKKSKLGTVAPIAATVLVLAGWLLWMTGAIAPMWTLVVLVLWPFANRGARILIRHAVNEEAPDAVVDDVVEHAGSEAAEQIQSNLTNTETRRLPSAVYLPVLDRIARILLVIIALAIIGLAWESQGMGIASSLSSIEQFFGAIANIVVALLIADLVWALVKTAIDWRLADYIPPEPGHPPGPDARLATLLPLLKKILLTTLLTMVALAILSSLGINIAPLLAGAGIIGIAVGFGTQALVKDIVSGIFFLLDDAFRIGEYIEVGTLRGTVEAMSVRSLRVRHHRGAVHTIPYGEMKSLTNYSRDWVIMKLEFRVPFETDLKLVKNLVQQIGDELTTNPELGPHIIEPLKSQGVRRMEEFNMVIGVKFMTKPGQQWTIRKQAYQKIRDAFDANGLGFAERNVKVEVISQRQLSDAERQAAIGAVQPVIEKQIQEQGAGTTES